jgi:hypothetical protein
VPIVGRQVKEMGQQVKMMTALIVMIFSCLSVFFHIVANLMRKSALDKKFIQNVKEPFSGRWV